MSDINLEMELRSYRDILRSELVSRIGRNPNYSLRAYARDLGIRPSHLSQVLNEKKGISPLVARKIASKMNLSESEQKYFFDAVESVHGRHKLSRAKARERLVQYAMDRKFKTLSIDRFALVADWYHFAILELLKIPSASRLPKDIATRFGLSEDVVDLALERLRRAGLIEDGPQLNVSTYHGTAFGDVPADSIRLHHDQILTLAKRALVERDTKSRNFSSTTVAIEKSKLPIVKEKIRKFQQEMDEFLESSTEKDSVYCLSIQFFDLLAQNG